MILRVGVIIGGVMLHSLPDLLFLELIHVVLLARVEVNLGALRHLDSFLQRA